MFALSQKPTKEPCCFLLVFLFFTRKRRSHTHTGRSISSDSADPTLQLAAGLRFFFFVMPVSWYCNTQVASHAASQASHTLDPLSRSLCLSVCLPLSHPCIFNRPLSLASSRSVFIFQFFMWSAPPPLYIVHPSITHSSSPDCQRAHC